jgi:hypothetical protein
MIPLKNPNACYKIPALLMSERRPSKKKTMYASFSYSRNLPLMFVLNAHPVKEGCGSIILKPALDVGAEPENHAASFSKSRTTAREADQRRTAPNPA